MKKRRIKTLIITALSLTALYAIHQANQFEQITPKSSEELIRIGYINLNQSKISKEQLIEYSHFDCDIWLFAEWNGNNLELREQFKKPYEIAYEQKDDFTYGFLVLAKEETLIAAYEVDNESRPYTCDYQKIMATLLNAELLFLHAPPPVPTCNFESGEYISDALKVIETEGDKTSQILIGDLNTLKLSNGYRRIIKHGFKDVFDHQGLFKGTFGGFSAFPKMLRIDYAFVKGNVEVRNAKRFRFNRSDHCGLLIDVKLN